MRFHFQRRASVLLAGLFLAAGATALRAAEKVVDIWDVPDQVATWGNADLYSHANEHGSCAVVTVVDPATGNVTNVYIESSTGNHYVNYKALEMMRKFKFKPGAPHLIRATFDLADGSYEYKPDRQSKPVKEVLAPFLHGNGVVKGRMPDYPRDHPWTVKHGTGVFVLHIGSTGHVNNVTVKRGSGDATFDEVVVEAMRKWQFRRGPLELEIPLYFALSPRKFEVHIPKNP
jgi:TonB family protein